MGTLEAFLPIIAKAKNINTGLPIVYICFGVSIAFGRIVGGRGVDSGRGKILSLSGLALAAAAAIGILIARELVSLCVIAGLFGVGIGACNSSFISSLAKGASESQLGSRMGWLGFSNDLGLGIGAGLAGMVAQRNVLNVPYLTVTLLIATLALLLAEGRVFRSRQPTG